LTVTDEMMGPVIVGYDGTDGGADALAFAMASARALDVGLLVAAVYPLPPAISDAAVEAEWTANHWAVAEEALRRARAILAGMGRLPAPHVVRDLRVHLGRSWAA
jgi:nucleotide-binding universal stress UspA family protein